MKKTSIIATVLLGFSLPAFSAITVQAYFEMGDNGAGADNRPTDSSGNVRNFGNIEGAATTISLTGGGYDNDAYYAFDGTQGYSDIGYAAPLDNVGIEVWVRTSNLTQENKTLFGTGSTLTGISIGYEGGQSGTVGWFGAVAGVAYVGNLAPANYTVGDWIHLAVVRDGGTSTFYVNGVPSGTTGAAPAGIGPGPGIIGYAPNGPGGFEGDIAQARIFTFDQGEFSTSDLLFPAIPEPATALLGGLGLLALLRRRRASV
jgi:hypothetical protein